MTETWKHVLDKDNNVGTVFMGLSKTFDTLKVTLKAFNDFKSKQQKCMK